MEDALVRLETWVKNDDTAVLILVLMEDALALAERSEDCKEVLILVVMEDALAHGGWAVKKLDVVRILILVVMEDALARMERRL